MLTEGIVGELPKRGVGRHDELAGTTLSSDDDGVGHCPGARRAFGQEARPQNEGEGELTGGRRDESEIGDREVGVLRRSVLAREEVRRD